MLFKSVKFLSCKVLFLTLLFASVIAFYPIAQASTAAVTQMTKTSSASSNSESQIPPNLSPQEIDAHLATMNLPA